MAEYSIDFGEMKEKVGVDDVAYFLGYRLNKKAGVGNRFELVLGPLDNPTDTIIVKNTDKKNQTYFRRNDTKGDVITLIRENINQFNVQGNNEWFKIINVLRQFANMPPVDYSDRKAVELAKNAPREFDSNRYTVEPVLPEKPHWLLTQRGFNKDCISDMSEFITQIKDNNQKRFDGFNIGFPYRNPETEEITGYEIRGGNGFKSKAAGTDSSHSCWYAEFGAKGYGVRNVYLFESSFDAMAFYQLNKARISLSPFALVSMGGSFTQNQVEGMKKRFPNAKFWDCFDNDLVGHTYAKNLVVYIDKKPLDIQYRNNENGDKMAVLTFGLDSVSQKADNFNFKEAARQLGVKYSIGHWKAPANYKDWNDCLLDKKIVQNLTPSKYERDRILAENRKSKSMSL